MKLKANHVIKALAAKMWLKVQQASNQKLSDRQVIILTKRNSVEDQMDHFVKHVDNKTITSFKKVIKILRWLSEFNNST